MQILCFQRIAVDKDAVCDFTKDLAELARQLVFETDAHPPMRLEADGYGFLLSFWKYPKGEALSCVVSLSRMLTRNRILGWYHMQTAQQAEESFIISRNLPHAIYKQRRCSLKTMSTIRTTSSLLLKFIGEAAWHLGGSVWRCASVFVFPFRKWLSFGRLRKSQRLRDGHLAVALVWERTQQQDLLEGTVTLDSVI